MTRLRLSEAVGEVHSRRGAGNQDRLQALQLREAGSNLSTSGQSHHLLVQQEAGAGGGGEEEAEE